MRLFRTGLLAFALACCAFAGFACSTGDADDDETNTGGTDEEYLAVVCKGLVSVTDALVGQTSVKGISDALKAYISSLEGANPPSDLKKFHTDYLKYLKDIVENDPTLVVTTKPKLPPEDVRLRIASKERDIPECRDRTFFNTGDTAP